MLRTFLVLLAGATSLAAAPPASAQSSSPRPSAAVLATGPRRSATVAGVVTASPRGTMRVGAPIAPRSRARSTTYMVIGGAAFVGGLLIGDAVGTLIAVGGLGVGIYGIYLYMQ